MGTPSDARSIALSYRNEPQNPAALRRCWPTGGIHLLVGVAMLLMLERFSGIGVFGFNIVARLFNNFRSEDAALLVILLAAYIDSIGGLILILFPMRWRRVLLASLTATMLAHLAGVLLGVGCIVFDDLDAQWGGLVTFLGLVVGVPCLLMLTLGLIAFVRVKRTRLASQDSPPYSPDTFADAVALR